MNNEFTNYVTATAFHLSLSKNQVFSLCVLSNTDILERFYPLILNNINFSTYNALKRRGLIEWKGEGNKKHGPYLTKVGRITLELIKEAELFPNEVKEVMQSKVD